MGTYTIMLNGDTDQIGPTANGLEYALDLDGHGHDVEVYFDGVGTRWLGELTANPEHPVNEYYEQARESGLIAGACEYCAGAFGATEGVRESGVDFVGDGGHGPDLGKLATEGSAFITLG